MDTLHDGRIVLHHGDCLDVMHDIPDHSVDAIICDPPYGTTACKWDSVIPFEPMWIQLKRIIKPRGAIVLFGSQPFTSALVMSNVKMFRYEWVWNKNRLTGYLNAHKQPLRKTENISIFYYKQGVYNPQMESVPVRVVQRSGGYSSKGKGYGKHHAISSSNNGLRFPYNILDIASEPRPIHPTQKPLAILEYLIRTYTNAGETILDFTFGSCTAGVAALNTDRRFIGIERDDTYYNLGLQRVQAAINALPPMPL